VNGTLDRFRSAPRWFRWTFLAVAATLVLTLIGSGIYSWFGRREAAAQRALGSVLATAQRAIGSGQATDLDASATALQQFLASHPKTHASQQAWYVLGQVEYRRGRWDAAAAAFGEASRRDRGSIGTLSRLGQGYAHEAKGDLARALEVYQQALGGISPKDFLYGDLLLAKARVHEQTNDSSGAIATYRQYLKDLPASDRSQDVKIRLALLGAAA
jgi:tetratricopeptide (TPR) repeat protein